MSSITVSGSRLTGGGTPDAPNPPTGLTYSPSSATVKQGEAMTPLIPTVGGGAVDSWGTLPALPAGLSIGPTGIIFGVPSGAAIAPTTFQAIATNDDGQAVFDVIIEITAIVAPSNLVYPTPPTLTQDTTVLNLVPTVDGDAVDTWVISGEPTGISIDQATGTLVGVAGDVGTFGVLVTATNAGGFTTATVTLDVEASGEAPATVSYPENPAKFFVGIAKTLVPVSTGGTPTSWSIGTTLPSGLLFDTVTGTVSGAAADLLAVAPFVVTGTNPYGSAQTTLQLEVVDAAPTALSYSEETPTYSVGTPITENIPTVTGTGLHTFEVAPDSPSALPSGLSINSGSGYITGTPSLVFASAVVKIRASNSEGSIESTITMIVADAAPTSLTYDENPATYVKGTPKTLTPSNTGGVITAYAVDIALPAGLSLNPTTGIIDGTATAVTASDTYRVTGTNDGGSTFVDLVLVVDDEAPAPFVYDGSPATLVNGTASPGFLPTSTGAGGAIDSYTSGDLPAGMVVNVSTGEITGTPTSTDMVGGTSTITGTNETSTTLASFVWVVNPAAPTSVTYDGDNSIAMVVGTPVSEAATIGGGTEFLIFTDVDDLTTLGLALDALTGQITGIPLAVLGATAFDVKVANVTGEITQAVTITIAVAAPTDLVYSPNPALYEVTPGFSSILASNAGGEIASYADVGGTPLPSGIVLNVGSGTLVVDTSAAIGSATYTIRGTNATGFVDESVTVEVTVSTPLAPTNLSYPAGAHNLVVATPMADLDPTVTGTVDSYTIAPALPNQAIPLLSLPSITAKVSPVSADVTAVDYTPPEKTVAAAVVGAESETLTIFYPTGTTPTNGWPTVLVFRGATYVGLGPLATLSSGTPLQAALIDLLDQGIAVITVGMATSGLGTGGQWFIPPGEAGLEWEDWDYSTHFKSSLMATQWYQNQSVYPLDPDRYMVLGESSTSISAVYSALAEDRGFFSGAITNGQIQQPTACLGVVLYNTLTSNLAIQSTFTAGKNNWESVATPGTDATNYGDADQAFLRNSSIHDLVLQSPSYAHRTPAFIVAEETLGSTDFTLDGDGFPALRNTLGAAAHDLWHAASLATRLEKIQGPLWASKGVFIVGNGHEAGLPAAQAALVTGTFASGNKYTNTQAALSAWCLARLTEATDTPSGLQIDYFNGVIFGRPTTIDPLDVYTITATNTSGSTTGDTQIEVIDGAPLSISYSFGVAVSFEVGVAFSYVATVVGGVPTTWEILPNPLLGAPAGLSFDFTDGRLFGTPTAVWGENGDGVVGVRGSNVSGSAEEFFVGRVYPAPPTVLDYNSGAWTITEGQAVALSPSITGSPDAFAVTVGTLPPGIVLNTATGELTGTATTPQGSANVTIESTNGVTALSDVVAITVEYGDLTGATFDYLPAGTPVGNYSFTKDATITPMVATVTGAIVDSFSVQAGTMPPGMVLNTSTGEITGTPNALQAAASITIRAANALPSTLDKVMTFAVVDTPPADFDYPGEATHARELRFIKGTAISGEIPTVSSGGAATSWSITDEFALNANGITFNEADGSFTGTPIFNIVGGGSFTVTATNSEGSVSFAYQLKVWPPAPTTISYGGTLNPLIDTSFAVTPTTDAQLGTWSSDPLPDGLSLNTSDGSISGVVTEIPVGNPVTVSVFVTNVSGQAQAQVTINVTSNSPSNYTLSPDRFPANEPTQYRYRFTLGQSVPTIVSSVDGVVDTFSDAPTLPNSTGTLGFGQVTTQPGTILPINGSTLDFAPAVFPGTPSANQKANVFLPLGTAPVGGWPFVITTSMGGFAAAAPIASLSSAIDGSVRWMLHELVNQGFAVIAVGFDTSGLASRGVWRDTTTGEWDSSDAYSFQEKTARWAIQKAKNEWAGTFGFNAARGGCFGLGQGGHVFAVNTLGADRAEVSGSAQEQTSTALQFSMYIREPNTWLTAYEDALVIGDVTHYAHSGTGFPNFAVSFATATVADLQSNSLSTLFRESSSLALTTPVLTAYDTNAGSSNYTLSGGLPVLDDALDPLTAGIDLWGGAMTMTILRDIDATFHAANSELWAQAGTTASLPVTQSQYVTGTFSGSATSSTALRDAIVAFALKHGDATAPNPDGLLLNADGTITGTPDTLQTLDTHTLTATSSFGSTNLPIEVEVTVAPTDGGSGLDTDDTVSLSLGEHAPDVISTGVPWSNWFLKGGLWLVPGGGSVLSTLLRGDDVLGHGYPDPSQSTGGGIVISNPQRRGFYKAGTWRLRWQGDGVVSMTYSGSDFTETASGTDGDGFSFIEYDVVGAEMNGSLRVDIDSFGANAVEDPVRDIQVFDPDHDEDSDLLHTDYVAFMEAHGGGAGVDSIRFFQSLKGIRYSVNDDRAAEGNPPDSRAVGLEDFTLRSKPGQNQGSWFGACGEYVVNEANHLLVGKEHAKAFVTVKPPTDAQDESDWLAYVNSWAVLYKDGSTVDGVVWPGLDPSIVLQIELGDELWNAAIRAGYGYYNRLAGTTGTPVAQLIAADCVKMYNEFLAAGWPAERLSLFVGGEFTDPSFSQAIMNAIGSSAPIGGVGPATYFKVKNSETGSSEGGYLFDFPNNLPTSASFFDDLDASIDNVGVGGWLAQLTQWVAVNSHTNPDGTTTSLESYEGGVNLQPTGPNNVDFPVTNPDGWYDVALDANYSPRLFQSYSKWMNHLSALGFRRVFHFSSAKAWLDAAADDASWGLVQHFGAEFLTVEPSRKARFVGPIEVKDVDETGFLNLPRRRFSTMEHFTSRGEAEIPAVVAPRGAPQWRVYSQQGKYEYVPTGAQFTGVGELAHVVCAEGADPGDAIEIVEPVTTTPGGAGAGTHWGGGTAASYHVASWEGTANAGLPMALDIYGVDRDTIVIPTIVPHRYNQSNVEQGGCAGLRFWNLTVQCGEFQRYAMEFGSVNAARLDTFREVEAPHFFGVNFVGEGNADQGGWGMFAGIRAYQVHPKNLRVSGCMFGALSDGVSQLPFQWDGATPNVDAPGVGEHCIYIDAPRGDTILEDLDNAVGLQGLFGDGQPRGSMTRTFLQVVQRENEMATPGTGRIILDGVRERNRWGSGGAAFTFVGYHGEIHARRLSSAAGFANENKNQMYRTLLTDIDPSKGYIKNANGFVNGRLVVSDLSIDLGSVTNVVGNAIALSSTESSEIWGFDNLGAQAGRVIQIEDTQQSGDPVTFPNGEVKFYLKNRGTAVSSFAGFNRPATQKIRLANVDLGDATIDATYPNLR